MKCLKIYTQKKRWSIQAFRTHCKLTLEAKFVADAILMLLLSSFLLEREKIS